MHMKATQLLPLFLLSVACSGSEDGPRGQMTTGGSTSLGGSSVGGTVSAVGGGGSTSVAGSVATGGSTPIGGSAPVGGSVATGGAGDGGSVATGGSGGTPSTERPDQRTVVYLPDYRGSLASWQTKIDYSRVSYLNLCFANVNATGDVSYKEDANLNAFVDVAHANGVKVCMAIGGASVINDGGVYAEILKDDKRDGFVTKLTQYAVDHKLDCIDVDLEGNGVNQYYEAFVTSLADKLHAQNKEMTCAVSSWFGDKITNKAIQAFDFMNIMAYDLHNPGGVTSPVQSSSLAESTAEVDYWVNRGLPKSKAVYGVPFYGYKWDGGTGIALTYAEMLAQDPTAATQDQLTLGGKTTYLNSRATIVQKAKVAKTYGGIMVWELGQDATGDNSLMKAIADATP
jgi:chitinase